MPSGGPGCFGGAPLFSAAAGAARQGLEQTRGAKNGGGRKTQGEAPVFDFPKNSRRPTDCPLKKSVTSFRGRENFSSPRSVMSADATGFHTEAFAPIVLNFVAASAKKRS